MPLSFYAFFSLLLYLGILLFSSLFGSINILNSSSQLFLQALYGCIFVFSSLVPIRPSLQKKLLILIFIIASLLFIGYSFAPSFFSFLSADPYQFILRINGEHNHLGDLAGLGFVITLLASSYLILDIPIIFFALVIMAVSFSKSAFLGVLVVLFFLAIQKKGLYRVGFLILLVVSALIIGIYTKELSGIPFIQSGQKIMTQTLHLNPKPLLSVRDSYYPQVFRAWKTAPLEQFLFGYGPGNYIYPSIKTGVSTDLTPAETHNILLSIFIESGFLSLFWFLIFCILILYIGFKQKNPSVYLFLYLLINFQTDYTYVIPFFMGLFFFFAGQTISRISPETMSLKSFWQSALGGRAMGIFVCIFLTFFIYSGATYFSLRQEHDNLEIKLTQAVNKQDKVAVQKISPILEQLTPYNEIELVRLSLAQESIGNYNEAVRLLDKLSIYSPHLYLYYFSDILNLLKREKLDIKQYLEKRKKDFALFILSQEEKDKLNGICKEYAKMLCVE